MAMPTAFPLLAIAADRGRPTKRSRTQMTRPHTGASTTGTPLIARMAVEKHILANIVSAGTRCVGDRVYGTMLLGIPGGEDEYKEAKAYIESVGNVIVEEV